MPMGSMPPASWSGSSRSAQLALVAGEDGAHLVDVVDSDLPAQNLRLRRPCGFFSSTSLAGGTVHPMRWCRR